MIFSAKEHRESSYTKNEKANKLIMYIVFGSYLRSFDVFFTLRTHTKAVWTQIILLSMLWSFSLISLIIYGSVIKYLQAFLNCLQVRILAAYTRLNQFLIFMYIQGPIFVYILRLAQ